MRFDTIPGHQPIKQFFSKMIRENRVPHAMLFVGGEGYGKLGLALSLTMLLQCKDRSEGSACGECSSCKKILSHLHPDVHFAFPVIKKDKLTRKETTSQHFLAEWREFLQNNPFGDINDWLLHLDAIDKSPNINVAECSQIFKNLGLMTFEGEYKVQIIWYAELLGKEGNRLLKLIEEPSDNTIIILITHNRAQILNTLKSRCQIINVPPVDDASLKEYITSQYDLSDEDTDELTFLSAGNIRKANMLGKQNELNYSEDLMDWLRVAYACDPEKVVNYTQEMVSMGKQEMLHFLNYGCHFFREYLLYLNTQDTDKLRLTEKEKEVAVKMTKIIDINKTQEISEVLAKMSSYIRRNLALKSLVMQITLEINAILRAEVNNLVAR